VSISAAGSLATAYAVGIAVGGPLLTSLCGQLDRRLVLRSG
jgi:DHA1 family inner membrane transport protein